jgi:hypothetical protein
VPDPASNGMRINEAQQRYLRGQVITPASLSTGGGGGP